MAHLMISYQKPTTYALMDLTEAEFEMVRRALEQLHNLFEGFGAPTEETAATQALIDVMERCWLDDGTG